MASQVGIAGAAAADAGLNNNGFNELAASVATPVAIQVTFLVLFIGFPQIPAWVRAACSEDLNAVQVAEAPETFEMVAD